MLLEFAGLRRLPPLDPFVVADHFGAKALVDDMRMAGLGEHFTEHLLSLVELATPAVTVREHTLQVEARDYVFGGISGRLEELDGSEQASITLGQPWECLLFTDQRRFHIACAHTPVGVFGVGALGPAPEEHPARALRGIRPSQSALFVGQGSHRALDVRSWRPAHAFAAQAFFFSFHFLKTMRRHGGLRSAYYAHEAAPFNQTLCPRWQPMPIRCGVWIGRAIRAKSVFRIHIVGNDFDVVRLIAAFRSFAKVETDQESVAERVSCNSPTYSHGSRDVPRVPDNRLHVPHETVRVVFFIELDSSPQAWVDLVWHRSLSSCVRGLERTLSPLVRPV